MKKVIFICLLSLSMCLSRPDGPPGPPDVPTQSPKTQLIPQKPEQTQQTPNSLPTQQDGVQPGKASETPAQNSQNAPQNQTSPHETDKPKGTSKPADENKTVPEKPVTDASKNNPSTTLNPTSTTIISTEKDQGKTTSTASPITSTTVHNTTKNETISDKSDVPKHENTIVQARGFDGASFIGGIILTLGLLAIGFMGFKYYKNQTERNYHTL